MKEDKKNLVILDKCLEGVTGLDQLSLFTNSDIVRLTDIGLKENSLDKDIVDKAVELEKSNEYLSVSILTEDKGRDSDKTLITPHPGILIIYCSYKNIIEKLKDSGLKNPQQWKNYYIKIHSGKIVKTKIPKYGKTMQTKVKNIENKKVYDSSYTR